MMTVINQRRPIGILDGVYRNPQTLGLLNLKITTKKPIPKTTSERHLHRTGTNDNMGTKFHKVLSFGTHPKEQKPKQKKQHLGTRFSLGTKNKRERVAKVLPDGKPQPSIPRNPVITGTIRTLPLIPHKPIFHQTQGTTLNPRRLFLPS